MANGDIIFSAAKILSYLSQRKDLLEFHGKWGYNVVEGT